MNFLVSAQVKLVERTIKSEHHRSPNRPIYLVGQSFGGCRLALAVAAFNPDIDLVLILANPGKKFLFYIYCIGKKKNF
jgi:predicted alpha/beta-fold hydrolase